MVEVGNMKNIIVRQAMDGDMEEIKTVVRSAFDRPGKNESFNEWEFTGKVRNDAEFIPKLCLVAVGNNEIVGYILLSKALIGKKWRFGFRTIGSTTFLSTQRDREKAY